MRRVAFPGAGSGLHVQQVRSIDSWDLEHWRLVSSKPFPHKTPCLCLGRCNDLSTQHIWPQVMNQRHDVVIGCSAMCETLF